MVMPAKGTPSCLNPFDLAPDMISADADDLDLDRYFDSSTPLHGIVSPLTFLPENLRLEGHSSPARLLSDGLEQTGDCVVDDKELNKARLSHSSVPSSASPCDSFRDSSSDSSVEDCKSSAGSLLSTDPKRDVVMADIQTASWSPNDDLTEDVEPGLSLFDGTVDPIAMNDSFAFNDKSMEDDFDFESAASSPSPFRSVAETVRLDMESPGMPTIKYGTPGGEFSKPELNFRHSTKISQNSITRSMHGLTTSGSRETSPLSAMVGSHQSSPSAFFNASPSPGGAVEYVNGSMLSGSRSIEAWQPPYDYNAAQNGQERMTLLSLESTTASPAASAMSPLEASCRPTLTIHPTPLKSRVETQIPIKMTLFPLPAGISRLHLPTHTISKPKLLAKPTPAKAADTLELYTALVCTSAMIDPENQRRAFARAADKAHSQDSTPISSAEEEDESKPLNGGDVRICQGCITRERKRAARKKVKKVEEEESWHKDEHRRVVVFNTHEIKEWQHPSSQVPSEATGDRPEPIVPDGAMQVDAPMRIACYCRHQNEKLGFQVIFTIKDSKDRLIAQAMTSSIMITDDHKTHGMPNLLGQPLTDPSQFAGVGLLGSEATAAFEMPVAPFRVSHSSSDLQNLQRSYTSAMSFAPSITPTAAASTSHNTSAAMTPRNLSRQGSPSGCVGPSSKKRKASATGKVPTGLAMTRLDTVPLGPSTMQPVPPNNAATTATSPYMPGIGPFSTNDIHLGGLPHNTAGAQQFNTGPPTPNSNDHGMLANGHRSQSMENLVMHQMYSAPTSAHPSRAPSPNGLRNSAQAYQQQQAQIAQAVANGLYGLPLAINPHRPPTIHKLIPGEGPKAGGVEVTCLGSGFCQGLEVIFGDTQATTTTFWGETSLVCLLPPSTFAGTVAVTFKHHRQQAQMQPYPTPPPPMTLPKQQAYFRYVDDDEQQIIRLALSVLGHKMNGKVEDVRELARRIVGDGSSNWNVGLGQSQNGGPSGHQAAREEANTFGPEVETILLRILDLIDLDDGPRQVRFNLRNASGQTMLHLACSLGLNRLVAALLARGVNPEPRDRGGFTPMHFAALNSHPQIVRRLILAGADQTMRSLQGCTPADVAISSEVLYATRRVQHHNRTRSAGWIRSQPSSTTSLGSSWRTPSHTQIFTAARLADPYPIRITHESESGTMVAVDAGTDADTGLDDAFYMRSRRSSVQQVMESSTSQPAILLQPTTGEDSSGYMTSSTAAVSAFRDQLGTQIAHLQQSMHLTLPQLPQLQTYQNYLPSSPMVRRISSMVPSIGGSRPLASEETSKEAEYKWWDLFSGVAQAAPPAYDEIFPNIQRVDDIGKQSVGQAVVDTVADLKCAKLFDHMQDHASSSTLTTNSILLKQLGSVSAQHMPGAQQEQLRRAHAERVKRLRSDRNLFFIWIPLLIFIVLAMLYNRLPQLRMLYTEVINSHYQDSRAVEAL